MPPLPTCPRVGRRVGHHPSSHVELERHAPGASITQQALICGALPLAARTARLRRLLLGAMASSQHEEAEERRRRKEAKKGQAGGKETPVMDGQSCEERREIREELRKLLDEISKKNQVRAWVGRALLAPRLRTLTPLGPPHTPFYARARAEPTRHSSHTCVYRAFQNAV